MDRELLMLIQKRVANIAIGASSLRGQGPRGTIQKAREFMARLDLKTFKDITERQFKNRLDKYTKELMGKLPGRAKRNWGGARKAMNVFLEDAFYNRFLAKTYGLDKLKDVLELPLDSNAVEGLEKEVSKANLPDWNGIKNLKPEDSEKFQEHAKLLAQEKGISRIYLDLFFWRA